MKLNKRLPGRPRMVKYGRHSVKPELCRTQDRHRPEYEYTAVTTLSKRSSVAHWSIPVEATIPAKPIKLRTKPITWHSVAAMVPSLLRRWKQQLKPETLGCNLFSELQLRIWIWYEQVLSQKGLQQWPCLFAHSPVMYSCIEEAGWSVSVSVKHD